MVFNPDCTDKEPGVIQYRHTTDVLWVQLQITAIKLIITIQGVKNEFFGFPVHMFIVYHSLLRNAVVLSKQNVQTLKNFAKKC